MKLLILCDLHIKSGAYTLSTDVDCDVLILTGDIHPRGGSLPDWAARRFGRDKPIVIVPGKHEFYGTVLADKRPLDELAPVHERPRPRSRSGVARRRARPGPRLHAVDRLVLPVRISAQGTSPEYRSDPLRAMRVAGRALSDYALIAVDLPAESDKPGAVEAHIADDDLPPLPRQCRLRPDDTLRLHIEQRDWLLARLQEPFAGTTVVVTHHAPSHRSVTERWVDDWVAAAFASEWPDVFFEVPVLWVHGYMHTSFDYVQGRTRVVCNARGHRWQDHSLENPLFDPRLGIDTDVLYDHGKRLE